MQILLVGKGGREHALAWKIAQSPQLTRLICVPGNPGMTPLGAHLDLATPDIPAFAAKEGIDLVVVGPEAPLAEGLADALSDLNIPCFGPNRAGAQLETSKSFVKALAAEQGIPTARAETFTDAAAARAALDRFAAPYVIKADGLAAGKGVTIAPNRQGAEDAIDMAFAGRFGDAGKTLLIEDFMAGTEMSVFALTDGERLMRFGTAQDWKRAYDGDRGPNTGGMGCISPSPLETPALMDRIEDTILRPTLSALQQRGITYRGVLYAGLMITENGPKLIEYNCRFGDPECQLLMRRFSGDLVSVLYAAATGTLGEVPGTFSPEGAANVVYAAKGYPETYERGTEIKSVDAADHVTGALVFHAGTRTEGDRLLADGGRVLNVTATGQTVADAVERAYEAIGRIDWPEGFYRRDIGC
ncbi:phosphoribosylamine--glycine ligase [Parvularcula bermudensis HTCC2503]|uniref:Phosphoribosylamine--glycine ligase n=1 Tax=Parvularcula bermudensis (strain ATCC BAA-594 / HTCC2503 / KCTC 12087) TaxID=314260 RepID=E0TG40_PARBH|nr:phosphoribosylamine--glycine ligase [Parvularcula bermudensis]ADM10611.1 phosphoribosylamine--glycine ligase [Parvularcula bermudensis HTCC2503]